MDNIKDKLLSLDEVSAYLKISKSTLYKLSQRNKIPSVKIGKQLRFSKCSIDHWLARKEHLRPNSNAACSVILDEHALLNSIKSYGKVLLVDDNDLVLRTLQRVLTQFGYLVDPAESGESALIKAKEKTYDLIIVDVRMPGISGIETIKRLRELSRSKKRKHPAEIIITGFMDVQAHQQAEKMGIADYVYKPFALDEFIAIVGRKIGEQSKTNHER
jgi:excisionase family DNA binding protein